MQSIEMTLLNTSQLLTRLTFHLLCPRLLGKVHVDCCVLGAAMHATWTLAPGAHDSMDIYWALVLIIPHTLSLNPSSEVPCEVYILLLLPFIDQKPGCGGHESFSQGCTAWSSKLRPSLVHFPGHTSILANPKYILQGKSAIQVNAAVNKGTVKAVTEANKVGWQ